MKTTVIIVLLATAVLNGCLHTQSTNTAAVESSTLQVNSQPESTITVQPIKHSRCGMSPPVLKKLKIQEMLIKTGKIAQDASPELMAQQVKQYIANKQRAFNKKCRN